MLINHAYVFYRQLVDRRPTFHFAVSTSCFVCYIFVRTAPQTVVNTCNENDNNNVKLSKVRLYYSAL